MLGTQNSAKVGKTYASGIVNDGLNWILKDEKVVGKKKNSAHAERPGRRQR